MDVAGVKLGPGDHAGGHLLPDGPAHQRLGTARRRGPLGRAAGQRGQPVLLETARQLDLFNRERQDIERQMTEEAERLIESRFAADPGSSSLTRPGIPGVVGIVAGRVTRKYNRPCIVLGNEGDAGQGLGAQHRRHQPGRGPRGLRRAPLQLGRAPDGGRRVAARRRSLEAFRARFAAAVREHVGGRHRRAASSRSPPGLRSGRSARNSMDELDALHPFGQGNPEPVFGIRGVCLAQAPEVFKEQHFRFSVDGRRRPAPARSGLEDGGAPAAGGRAAGPRGRAALEPFQRPQAPPDGAAATGAWIGAELRE